MPTTEPRVVWDQQLTPSMLAWAAERDFHQLTRVAVGARVRFTSNLYMKEGAPNGCCGTVCGIDTDADRVPAAILVRPDDADAEIRVSRSCTERMRTQNSREWSVRRTTFPLALAYAMSAHARTVRFVRRRRHLRPPTRSTMKLGLPVLPPAFRMLHKAPTKALWRRPGRDAGSNVHASAQAEPPSLCWYHHETCSVVPAAQTTTAAQNAS